MLRRKIIALATALFPLFAVPAFAVPSVNLQLSSVGYSPITIFGTPDALPSYNNSSGPAIFGGFRLNVGIQGDPTILSFSAQMNAVVASQAITIAVTETGLVAMPATIFEFESTNTAILKTRSTAAFSTYSDPGNGAFTLTDPLSSGTATGPTNGQSQVYTLGPYVGSRNYTSTFSVTKLVTFTPATSTARPTLDGQVTFDVINIPEPHSLLLLGAGLLVLAGLRLRRGGAKEHQSSASVACV
jgi:hypothetical protein